MPDNNSAGQVSLDLVINTGLEKQVEKAQGAVQKMASGMESTLSKAAEETGKKVKENISGKMKSAFDEMEEKLRGFNVKVDPLERLEQQLGNTKEKMSLLQGKWKELSESLDNAEGEEAAEKLAGQLNSVERQIIQTQGAWDKLENKIESIKEAQNAPMEIKIAEQIEEEVQEVEEKVIGITDEIREKLGNYEIKVTPIERLEQHLKNAQEKMSLLQKKWQELQYALTIAGSEEETAKLKEQINSVEQQMISLQGSSEKTEAKINKMVDESAHQVRTKLKKAVSLVAKIIGKTLAGAFKLSLKAGGKAIKSLRAGFTKLKSAVTKLTTPVQKLGKNIKSAFKSAILMAGLYAAFRALKDGFAEAAMQNEQFSKSLNDVKANLSIAFTPIMQAIMPALNSLMSGLASVTKSVAGFISGLFGTTYKQAAEATKKLKGVSDSAKKAKMSTAGIDEMNILSGGDSGSEESGGTDYSAIDTSEPVLPDWAEKLKESMKKGDWSGVGSILAERVNSAFSSVDWESLGGKVASGINTAFGAVNTFLETVNWSGIGKDLTKGLNQLVKKTDWKQIGKFFALRIQAVIDVLHSFVTGFDWSDFGVSIGESVNAWFNGIDFSKAGETLSGGVKGLLDTVIGFVQTVNWAEIGNKIADFVESIDWAGIARKAFELLGSALAGAITSVVTIIKRLGKGIADNFKDGFFNGIAKTFSQIGKWIKDNVFTPFLEGFKKCFDIHSPSGVMEEMGEYIVEGLCNAISAGITKVKESFEKILEKIHEVFSGIGGWFSEKFNSAYNAIKDVFTGIGGWFTDRWSDIKGVFSGIGDWFSEKFQTAYDNVTGIFSRLGEFFSGVWESVSTGAKSGINLVIDKVNGLVAAVESAINFLIDAINSISIDIPDWIPEEVGGGKTLGFNFSHVNIPDIPRLANGGLATAPVLSMVGDNRNARHDPEVISPLSKLKGMMGEENSEIVELLRIIVELLRNGMNIELINYLFNGSREFSREVIKVINAEKARKGGEL